MQHAKTCIIERKKSYALCIFDMYYERIRSWVSESVSDDTEGKNSRNIMSAVVV